MKSKNKYYLIPLLAFWAMSPSANGQETVTTETTAVGGTVEFEISHERADFYTNGTVKAAAPWQVKRDPFWPLNWKPIKPKPIEIVEIIPEDKPPEDEPPPVPEVDIWNGNPPNWLGASRKLQVINKKKVGDTWLVTMANLGVKEPGSVITLEYDDNIYTWRIAEIHPDSIRYDRVDVRPK